jgi:hypothetical protein
MQLVINGRIVPLHGFADQTTGQPDKVTEHAVQQLFAAFLAGQVYDLDQFITDVQPFFTAHSGDAEAHNQFFNNIRGLWEPLRSAGRDGEAGQLWVLALAAAARWESANPEQPPIHKGIPYYFYGAHCLLRGDLDFGYALMHQALSEDVRLYAAKQDGVGEEALPPTPARAFVALDWTESVQPFREWVNRQATFIEERIAAYRVSHQATLEADAFRSQFLQRLTRPEVLNVFAYTVARLMSVRDRRRQPTSPYALGSPFVGQLEAGMCFDLLLVVDNAIKEQRPTLSSTQPIDLAAEVARTVRLLLTRPELGQINAAFQGDREGVLEALLDRSFVVAAGRVLGPVEADLALAYALRNDTAHDLGSINSLWRRFPEVEQSLFNVLFLVAEHLYGARGQPS